MEIMIAGNHLASKAWKSDANRPVRDRVPYVREVALEAAKRSPAALLWVGANSIITAIYTPFYLGAGTIQLGGKMIGRKTPWKTHKWLIPVPLTPLVKGYDWTVKGINHVSGKTWPRPRMGWDRVGTHDTTWGFKWDAPTNSKWALPPRPAADVFDPTEKYKGMKSRSPQVLAQYNEWITGQMIRDADAVRREIQWRTTGNAPMAVNANNAQFSELRKSFKSNDGGSIDLDPAVLAAARAEAAQGAQAGDGAAAARNANQELYFDTTVANNVVARDVDLANAVNAAIANPNQVLQRAAVLAAAKAELAAPGTGAAAAAAVHPDLTVNPNPTPADITPRTGGDISLVNAVKAAIANPAIAAANVDDVNPVVLIAARAEAAQGAAPGAGATAARDADNSLFVKGGMVTSTTHTKLANAVNNVLRSETQRNRVLQKAAILAAARAELATPGTGLQIAANVNPNLIYTAPVPAVTSARIGNALVNAVEAAIRNPAPIVAKAEAADKLRNGHMDTLLIVTTKTFNNILQRKLEHDMAAYTLKLILNAAGKDLYYTAMYAHLGYKDKNSYKEMVDKMGGRLQGLLEEVDPTDGREQGSPLTRF